MGLIISTEGAGFPPRGAAGSFKLPFQEQIDFFNQKNPLPSQHYDDILKSAHDRAFIVAGAAKADLLNDLHGAVKQTINEGKTLDWFRGQFDAIVKKHGWTGWTGENSAAGVAWRTRVIYQTNLSTSYAAGRWAQLNDPDLLKVRPYWKYIHNDSVAHPRELHKSWNGTVLRHDDPWWATHFAPNGWNCFTPDTLVSGDFDIGLKSFYSGKVFKFTTRSGAYFTVTANHPILSEQGWVEAKTLNKGDNLLRYTGVVDADTPVIVNNQNPPAPAKEWFESLAGDAFGICKISSFDFHGDTELRKGDVYVSGTECVLMDNFKPLPLEQLKQGDFKWTDDGGIECKTTTNGASIINVAIKKTISFNNGFYRWSGISSFIDYFGSAKPFVVQTNNKLFKVIISSVRCFPSRFALPNNSVWVKLYSLPFNRLSLAHCASSCSRFTKRVSNNASANAVPSSNRFLTFAREICGSNLAIIKPYFLGISPRKSMLFNQFFKRKAFDSVAFTDFSERYHGQVVIDDIVGIEESFYSGHVYTFQSKNEIIVANGIITHNCRCRIMAVRATEYKGKPAPNDGTYQHIDRNGVAHTLPKGIDYGFDYAPNQSIYNKLVTNKAAGLPDKLASDFLADTKKIMANDTGYWLPDTDQAAWHEASFKESPDWIKAAIKQHDDKFNGLLPKDVDKSFFYFRDKKAIHTGDADMNTYKNQGTWRHEYGHFLDNIYGNDVKYRSSQRDFKKAVTADTRQLLKASGIKASDSFKAKREQRYFDVVDEVATLNEVDRKIYLAGKAEEISLSLAEVESFFSKESIFTTVSIERDARMAVLLRAIKDQDAAKFMESIIMSDAGKIKETYKLGLVGKFSDLVGSSTVNQLLGHGYMGMGGHATSYYMVAGNAETEVFANLTALFGSNSPVWKTTVESFFPVLSQLFKDIFHGKA